MKLVVTTGATVTFKSLLAKVLAPQFLAELAELGFSDIVVQYGRELRDGADVSAQFVEQLGIPDHVTAIGLTNDVDALLAHADVVVSHAGTGAILDALRRGLRLVVVPNEDLMGNHQTEIATQFAGLGVCEAATVALLTPRGIARAAETEFLPLAAAASLESVVAHEIAGTPGDTR